MKSAHTRIPCALLLAAATLVGCTEIPPNRTGRRIEGAISYQGTAHQAMRRPAVRVMVLVDFPPSNGPLGYQLIEAYEQPDFPARVDYELIGIQPYRYKVFGQLVDIAEPDRDPTTLPLGAWPNTCALPGASNGLVEVRDDVPTTGIDFALYDLAGATDPCNVTTTVCPLPGKATMRLTIESSVTPGPMDRMVVALFSTFPSTTPSNVHLLPAGEIILPKTVVDNTIAPGNYAGLYVCLDVGGDSGIGTCSQEDAFVVSTPSTPYAFPAGGIVNLVVNLDTRQATLGSVDDSTAAGCP